MNIANFSSGFHCFSADSWILAASNPSFQLQHSFGGISFQIGLTHHKLEKCINHFQTYYNSKYHGRKLAWLHHLSKGDLRSLYLKKKYEFQATNYQIAVLLQFNTADTLSMESIGNSTNLKESELVRTLEVSRWVQYLILLVFGRCKNTQGDPH